MARNYCHFESESESYTEILTKVWVISVEEADIIRREVYPHITNNVLKQQVEAFCLVRRLVLWTEFGWFPYSSDFDNGVQAVIAVIQKQSQVRFTVQTEVEVNENLVPLIRVHSYNIEEETDKNPLFLFEQGPNGILGKLSSFEDDLHARKDFNESILGISLKEIESHLHDLFMVGACRFHEGLAKLLKQFKIKFKNVVLKGFRTKLKEALLLAKKKAFRKVTMAELMFMQRLPLVLKIKKSILRIIEYYEYYDGDIYVSVSGGKDSSVLLHLIRSIYPDVVAVFCNTGLELPKVRDFALAIPNLDVVRPKMSFYRVLKTYGYPVIDKAQAFTIRKLRHQNLTTKYRNKLLYGDEKGNAGKLADRWKYLLNAPFEISEQCCKVMKKDPLYAYEKKTGKFPVIATLAVESRNRTIGYLKSGCNAFEKAHPQSTPLGFWTEQDVLQYIKLYNVAISPAYGEIVEENGLLTTTGEKRTGCAFCLFGIQHEKGENRIQRMARTEPKMYKYCIEKLRLDVVMDYIKVDYRPIAA